MKQSLLFFLNLIKTLKILIMRVFIFVLLGLAISSQAAAQADCRGYLLRFVITTGSDDLRSGNEVYFTVNLTDRTSLDEMEIGGGYKQNSVVTVEKELTGYVDLTEIRSITLRHDGTPIGPFDTYDNWDLQAIRISLIDEYGEEFNIYNSVNDRRRSRFVTRFTGDNRNITVFRQR
jgi:hypothetical protein